MAINPQGVRFDKGQTEYQLFPEEYFASTDVTVYFNDVWVDDITALQFKLTEKVVPIYGYASKTWDYVLRGKRLVQGQFRIAFREAGYLYTILDHIGQLKDKSPALAYIMNDKPVPKWHGQVKQRIEDVLRHWHEPNGTTVQERKIPPFTTPLNGTEQLNPNVQALQTVLSHRGYYNAAITGNFDEITREAVKNFQRANGLSVTGKIGAADIDALSTVEKISTPSGKTTSGGVGADPNALAESRVVQYEKEIWGRNFVENGEQVRNIESFFYRGRTTDVNGLHTSRLYQEGIDIYIPYGPLPEYVKNQLNNKLPYGTASFNTTVKAIRNVQIYDVEQVLDARTAEPIEEIYYFYAQDLD